MHSAPKTKREALNIPIEPDEALLDEMIMSVSPQAFKLLRARLDMPSQPNKRLVRTMTTPAPWERK